MKYQVLLSLKNNEKYSKLLSAAFVIGTLKVDRDYSRIFIQDRGYRGSFFFLFKYQGRK